MQKPLKSPLTKNPRFVDEIKDDKVRDEQAKMKRDIKNRIQKYIQL
jgi:hypothetical protein